MQLDESKCYKKKTIFFFLFTESIQFSSRVYEWKTDSKNIVLIEVKRRVWECDDSMSFFFYSSSPGTSRQTEKEAKGSKVEPGHEVGLRNRKHSPHAKVSEKPISRISARLALLYPTKNSLLSFFFFPQARPQRLKLSGWSGAGKKLLR